MANFIRLTQPGSSEPILINVEQVTTARPHGSGTLIFFAGDSEDSVMVHEGFGTVESMLTNA